MTPKFTPLQGGKTLENPWVRAGFDLDARRVKNDHDHGSKLETLGVSPSLREQLEWLLSEAPLPVTGKRGRRIPMSDLARMLIQKAANDATTLMGTPEMKKEMERRRAWARAESIALMNEEEMERLEKIEQTIDRFIEKGNPRLLVKYLDALHSLLGTLADGELKVTVQAEVKRGEDWLRSVQTA